MVPYYHIDYDFGKTGGINSDLDWFIMDHICEPVNDD